MLGASVAILAVALVVGTAGGISPAHVASRLGSGLNASGDPGNQDRFTTMKNALDHYAHMSLPTKALGAGIASTGNISQLTEVGAVRTESYVLKLLIEVGIVGTIL